MTRFDKRKPDSRYTGLVVLGLAIITTWIPCLWAALPAALAIQSDSVTFHTQQGTAVYQGHVVATHQKRTMWCDRAEVFQDPTPNPQGKRTVQRIVAYSSPHTTVRYADHQTDVPLTATAHTITYDAVRQVIELHGNAHIVQGQHEVKSAHIVYHLDTHVIHAPPAEQPTHMWLHPPTAPHGTLP